MVHRMTSPQQRGAVCLRRATDTLVKSTAKSEGRETSSLSNCIHFWQRLQNNVCTPGSTLEVDFRESGLLCVERQCTKSLVLLQQNDRSTKSVVLHACENVQTTTTTKTVFFLCCWVLRKHTALSYLKIKPNICVSV